MDPAHAERHIVLVVGANGVGKTSLLKRLGVRAARSSSPLPAVPKKDTPVHTLSHVLLCL